ncbi:MAG: hypothetical protein R3E50_06900 [Halioglobus sp.]
MMRQNFSRSARNALALATVLQASAVPATIAADQAQWADAKEIAYRITGEFDGRFPLGTTGDAHATDRVEIEFTTNADGDLQGDVTIRNFKSAVSDPQPVPKGCRAPELKGEIEFYTLRSLECMACSPEIAAYADPEESGAASKNMTMSVVKSEREYPDMLVGAACTGKLAVAAHTQKDGDMFTVPARGELMVAPEPGKIVVQNQGWTWTYQATPIGT